MFASVIIDNASSNTDYEFEYLVPEYALAFIKVGCRVKVKFGTSERLWMGYVIDLHEESLFEGDKKEIIEVLDLEPLINEEQLVLSEYIKNDTICPRSRVLNLMIPSALRLKSSKYLVTEDVTKLDANLAILFKGKNTLKITNELESHSRLINKALKDGLIKIMYDASDTLANPQITKYFIKEQDFQNKLFLVTNSLEIDFLNYLKNQEEPSSLNEIIENYPISSYRVKKLAEAGIIEKQKFSNIKHKKREVKVDTELIKLNDKFIELLNGSKELLWMPSSNNEELTVILEILKQDSLKNKKTLILVPDILSSYRYQSLISLNTDAKVLCLNSEIGSTENYEIYEQIRKENFDVMVTTPVGALYPYQDIGTILIIDQESENYRNDQSPRYDLNEVFKYRIKNIGQRLIFHSYAPTMKCYAESLTILPKLECNLPKIDVVNLKNELIMGNKSPISRVLHNEIERTLKRKGKVLLILNNKGYSQSVLCRNCGEVIKCDECDIPLQYQKEKEILVCPKCGKRKDFTASCPKCGSSFIRHIGLGMEKLKEVLEEEFEDIRVGVLKDSNYRDYEEEVLKLNDDISDVIISSDIFSRSIINEKIELVVVVALDIVTKSPSYHAGERAYSLLKHALNHLSSEDHKLVIQTYNPEIPVLKYFLLDEYDKFFIDELRVREIAKLDPIYEVNRIFIKSEYKEMYKTANIIKKHLYNTVRHNIQILGPAYNKQERCVQLLVKHQHKNINNVYQQIYKLYQNSKTMIIFDKYPRNI
ncbi:MAG: hypothetical protein IJX78_01430 [Bacilli bacterium]|nr:hypothetical protein [Bacilli bacterium]